MASMVRPALLRQAAAASSTLVSSRAAAASPRLANRSVVQQGMRQQSIAAQSARMAAFHTTSRRSILPPPPQRVEGGVNDPVPVPPPSPSHGSYHWTFERLIAASLVPLTVTPFAAGSLNPALDAVLCAAILVHSHLGFQSVLIDYVPKRRFPGASKFFKWGLNAVTALVALGLYEFETTDVGLTEAVARLWHA
ncbi:hypothetical protein VTK73DRAFT_2400 [Phialemonium thermophilum]|uniref:Succinate dehydrogenase [ubiquinone] cytochrome b small subunit n=1 Tax=Phialemonium thermophilum TaxID=223376 RepID=A0ABR3VS64_9PEZI